jgi:translation elongation factor EF-1alpha
MENKDLLEQDYKMDYIHYLFAAIMQYYEDKNNTNMTKKLCEYINIIDNSFYERVRGNACSIYSGDYWRYFIVFTILDDNGIHDRKICEEICKSI